MENREKAKGILSFSAKCVTKDFFKKTFLTFVDMNRHSNLKPFESGLCGIKYAVGLPDTIECPEVEKTYKNDRCLKTLEARAWEEVKKVFGTFWNLWHRNKKCMNDSGTMATWQERNSSCVTDMSGGREVRNQNKAGFVLKYFEIVRMGKMAVRGKHDEHVKQFVRQYVQYHVSI